jgi:imidazolonepropionase-like amidohydrolase
MFALTDAPSLSLDVAGAIVERAHDLGLKVACHALSEENAAQAASLDVDVLAHAPLAPLSAATVDAFGGRAVIGTLAAFGGGAVAVDNLRRLHEAGALVLYGTDLGNSQTAGIQRDEIERLLAAGLSAEAIIAAGTSAAASYWGLHDLGSLAEGKRASLLVLPSDPLSDPSVLASPDAVYIDGVRVGP